MNLTTTLPKPTRKNEEEVTLPSITATCPSGIKVVVTGTPHRDGNPDHRFYEVWFYWDGGTLRTSAIIHDEATRRAVAAFLEDLTGKDHYEEVSSLVSKYDWHTR